MRFGVFVPDDGRLPSALATPFPNRSAKLTELGDGTGVGGTERTLSEEWVGGDGGRVDRECRPLVKRCDTDAVALDAANTGGGGGVTGWKLRARQWPCPFRESTSTEMDDGCFSKILRRDCIARYPVGWSEDVVDSDDDTDSASIGGVVDRRANSGVTGRDRGADARVRGRHRSPADDCIVRTEDGEDTVDTLSVLEAPVDLRLEGKPNNRGEAWEETSERFTRSVRRW